MRLPRRFARLSLMLTGAGIAAIAVGMLFGIDGLLVGIGVFVILYIAATVIQMRYLRCPYCKKAVLPARWSRRGPVLCPRCGRQIPWDS